MSAGEALAKMSDRLHEDTDIHPTGVSIVVTDGTETEGNEISIVLHRPEESDEDDLLVGFEDREQFEKALSSQLIPATQRPVLEFSDDEFRALEELIDVAAWERPRQERETVERLAGRLPEVDPR